MKTLSTKAQKTLDSLVAKNKSFSSGVRMPSIKAIHDLLTEAGVEHKYNGATVNRVESRSGQNTYVNDRHDGKVGKSIEMNHVNTGYLGMDSSDSYYSWNTSGYARQLVKVFTELGYSKSND